MSRSFLEELPSGGRALRHVNGAGPVGIAQKRPSLETDSLSRFWPFSRHGRLVADPAVGRAARDMPAAQWVYPGGFRRGLVDCPVLTLAGMLDEPGLLETLKR